MKSLLINIWKNRVFNILLAFIISFGFIAFHFRGVNLATVWEGLKEAHMTWLIAGMFAMFLYWFLESLVLNQMTRQVSTGQTIWQSIKITMAGQFFNTITPFASGGQPGQLYLMAKDGIDVGVASSVLLIKFIVYQAMLVTSSAIILIFGYSYLQEGAIPGLSMMIIIGFMLNTGVIIMLITVFKNKQIASFLVHMLLKPASLFMKKDKYAALKVKVDQKLHAFHVESNRMSFNIKLLLRCSLLTIAQLWIFFSIPYFVLQGIGIPQIDLFQVIAFHSFIMMFSSLIPIPGGSGGAEFSFSLLFGLIMGPAALVLCLFFWRFITYYSCILFGSFFLFTKRKLQKASIGGL